MRIYQAKCDNKGHLRLSRKNPENDKILKSLEKATNYLLFLIKLDRKSNQGFVHLPPPKEFLFKTLQYLKSTLEIVWHPNSKVIIPTLIFLLPTPKKYIARKIRTLRKTTYKRILIELVTMPIPSPQKNKLRERYILP